MHPQSDLAPDLSGITSDELAEGLMLVRASTLKVIRLQLAMERRDRRVAIEAIDDLVALDRHLETFLARIPPFPGQQALEEKLHSERSALNREKLTLGAEVLRNGGAPALFQGPPNPADSQLITPPPTAEPAVQEVADEQVEWVAEPYEGTPRRWRWMVGLLLAIAVVVAAAFMLGGFELLPGVEAIHGDLT